MWMQTCDVANGKACCIVGESCCNDTSTWFDWKPGYITAVINGDGTNRLESYVSAQPSTSQSTPTAGSSESESPKPLSNPQSSSSATKAAIAVGVVLFFLLSLTTTRLFFERKRRLDERRRRLNERKARLESDATLQQMREQVKNAQERLVPVEVPAEVPGYRESIREVELLGTEIRELPPGMGDGRGYGQ
jgi:hypothetical protein